MIIGNMYYTHTDHLGSIVSITAGAGAEVFKASYDAWGKQTITNNTFKFHRGYTGHEHLPEFGLINMNARLYDPIVGRFLSPDPYVADATYSQDFNRYSYVRNNPLIYTDPTGELFWLIPNIGWSKGGGFSIGLSAVVGIPGLFSAQTGVGYSFGNNDLSAYVGATAAFNTVYVSASTQSGFSAGWSAGLSPQLGLPISTNFTSVGINYNFKNDALSGNLSAWNIDKNGWSFNPSISAMILPEHTTNLVKGQGFRNNDKVFDRMMQGDYTCQDILDYFNIKGKYNNQITSKNYQTEPGAYWGSTNRETGNISFGDWAFESYKVLLATYYKELYTHRNVRHNRTATLPDDVQGLGFDTYLEEVNGYMYAYKNQGLYRNSNFPWHGVGNYQTQLKLFDVGFPTYTTNRFLNFIYRVKRLW